MMALPPPRKTNAKNAGTLARGRGGRKFSAHYYIIIEGNICGGRLSVRANYGGGRKVAGGGLL